MGNLAQLNSAIVVRTITNIVTIFVTNAQTGNLYLCFVHLGTDFVWTEVLVSSFFSCQVLETFSVDFSLLLCDDFCSGSFV